MQLSLQNFTSLVQNAAAAAQGACAQILDFTVGSVVRVILEANASIALWLQWLILLVLQTTRAATSNGKDLDTWVADYSLTRIQPNASTGPVTFTRFTPTSSALIAVGVQVKTADGSRVFAVIADTTNALWNATLNGFLVPAAQASATVTVTDVTVDASGNPSIGSAGNVVTGAISLISSAIAGIDAVTNAVPFTNGLNAETDAALRLRFANYITTRSRATGPAITYAASLVQSGLSVLVQENVNAMETAQAGAFLVTIDDGSGSPPSSLISAVAASVALYRPLGTQAYVVAPPNTTATVALTITTNPTTNKPALLAPVQNAIIAYVNSLPVGASLSYARLIAVVFGVDPSISDVTSYTLNSATADLAPGASNGVVKTSAGSVAVT
jgi:uncharacterized phage protein gp47/JayE